MDESYIHQNHSSNFGLQTEKQKKEGNENRKSSKGLRLIIIHAITPDGPLTTYNNDGTPVDDIEWPGRTKDTPHSIHDKNKLTCECLWVAQSHTGNYHNNANSEIFMQWVCKKLVPTFNKIYPHKKMILVADNAPYHHQREIGSLASVTKKNLVAMMADFEVDRIDLPIKEERMALCGSDPDVLDGGERIRITFDPDEQINQDGKGENRARIATIPELRVSFVQT